MNFKPIIFPHIDAKECIEYLKHELDKIDFEPKFSFCIFTTNFYGKHKEVVEFLRKRLDFESVSFFVDAFVDENAIYPRGLALLLFDGEVKAFKTGSGDLERELEKIAEKLRSYDCALAIYPTLYFPSKIELLKGFARDRYYHILYRLLKSERFIRRFSDWLLENRIVIPINRVLRILSKAQIPIGSINLAPMEAKENTPLIMHNFEPIERNVLVLAFKKADIDFRDVFMERGNSYEETLEVLKKQFAIKDYVKVKKAGVVIAEINDELVKDYVEKLGMEKVNEEKFVAKVEKGEFVTVTPYGLAFINKETFGISTLGLLATPLNLYISFFETDDFFDEAIVVGEVLAFDPADFVKFENLSLNSRKIFFIDYSSLLEYGGEVYRMYEWLTENQRNFLLIFVSYPSAFKRLDKRFLSENGKNIYYNGSGTTVLLKLGRDAEKEE